jgi:hypothetical protein
MKLPRLGKFNFTITNQIKKKIMKRITLLLLFMATMIMSFGQALRKADYAPVKQEPANDPGPDRNSIKAGGDVFWSTTFNWGDPVTGTWSLPAGWTIVDNTDFGNPWIWRSPYDSLGGQFTVKLGPSKNFTTPLDGYIVIPIDEYNYRNNIETKNIADTYIMTPPIDCSSKTSVTVKFKQYFRNCCVNDPTLQMLVSNDGGVHWAAYDCNFGLSANRITDARYQNVEFNISDVAAGMANVLIKFSYTGSYLYYWMIDDMTLSEAYQNDLVLSDYWSDFNGGFDARIGHINYWPISQMGMPSTVNGNIGDYSFRGAFLNNGMADQESVKLQMTIQRNGTQVYQDVSNPSTIWSLERDTSTVNSVFLANDYGDYQFHFAAISDNDEEVPANNSVNQSFTVNDTLFHRADFSAESGSNTGGWEGGANGGDMVGVFYDIYAPCEINSISAYIYSITMAEAPTFQFILQKFVADDDIFEVITSEIIEATADQASTWVTLDLGKDGESEFLQPGKYIACVKFWGVAEGDANGTNGMSIGWDKDNNQDTYTYNYRSPDASWFNTGKLNLIGININTKGGPTQAPVTFNVDMTKHIASGEFKPGTDNLDVTGLAPSWSGTASMSDPDGNGIYSATVDGLTVASVLNYKYRLNGIPEAYPLTGNPYRSYTVRYWNIINDTYNGGVTTGINPTSLMASFNVYPNPASGAFTVDVTSTVPSNLVITLTNIQGQIVYQNRVTNTVSHQEIIGNNLSKGLYFLTVNNGKEIKVQKVVVQ